MRIDAQNRIVEQDADLDQADPRLARSRARLLDAATHLLATGGIDAVTIDAVTRTSKVARTTLYRHFGSSTHLLAATFGNVHGVYKPGNVKLRPEVLLEGQKVGRAKLGLPTMLCPSTLSSTAAPAPRRRRSKNPSAMVSSR